MRLIQKLATFLMLLLSAVSSYGQCSPDTTAPNITCPANITAMCPHDRELDMLSPTSTDNCGITLQTYTLSGATSGTSPATGIHDVNSVIFLAGTTTVTYRVADAAGNSASCNFTVTITDFSPPIVSCRAGITRPNDPGLCTAYVNMLSFTLAPSAADNCSGISTVPTNVPANSLFPVGTTTVLWVISDAAGNSSTCTQDITVTDEEPPTIVCPTNITVNTDPGQCNANVTIPTLNASDNCAISSITNSYNSGGATASGNYPLGTTTVTFTVVDTANKTVSCSMEVTVVDSQNPTIQLSGDNPLTLEACATYNEPGATANDSCFGNISGNLVIDTSELLNNTVGTYNVYYTVTNTNGGTFQTTRTVHIVDTTSPTLTLLGPNPFTIVDCSTYTELGAEAFDPCFGNISGNVMVDNSTVDTSIVGSYTVTYNVTDDHGNSTGQITRTVNVVDTTSPEIVLIGDNPQFLELCQDYVELGATAIDPCTNADFSGNLVIDSSTLNINALGTYYVTYNVMDTDGNVAIEVIREVEVVDTTLPTLTCPSDITIGNDLGLCSAVVTYASPLATDNCPITVQQITGLPSGSVFPLGTTTNSFEITDTSGQVATCSFDIVVTDTELPTVLCKNFSLQLDSTTGTASIGPSDIDNGSYDNCALTLSISQSTFDCDDLGDVVVTLTATDGFGNISTCEATVTVTDFAQDASLTITSSSDTICQNESVTFTAIAVNAGSNPIFQWLINGVAVDGETGSSFITTVLNDGDSVTSILTISASFCNPEIVSNVITINVNDYNPQANAGVDIITNDCTNTTITLAAEPIIGTETLGTWTVTSGQTSDFSFSDITSPTSTFSGDIGETYELTWSLDNPSPCPDSSDVMTITFVGCSALDFDGVDDNITFRNNYNFSNDFSIELWMKSEILTNDIQTLFSKREANNLIDGYDLRIVDNYVSFNWNDGQNLTSPYPIKTDIWHHIAVTYNSGSYILYIDGIEMSTASGDLPISNAVDAILGAMDQSVSPPFRPLHYFNGGMDEFCIWDVALSASQIRKMMNQEIENDNGNVRGSVVPIDIPGIPYAALNSYYRMNQTTDIATGNLISTNNNPVFGVLRYMTTLQPESAPLPYQTRTNGLWSDANTWLNGDVQSIPSGVGVDNTTLIEWNIVRTNHNVSSGNENLIVLGLDINSNTLYIENSDPSDGQSLRITDYLLLNGTLDLVGESQLLQDRNSLVDYSGSGNLQRDQQGTSNLFNYNYWSSPVSGNGVSYSVNAVLKDGTSPNNPTNINWTTSYNATGSINPITLSKRWIYTYEDTPGADYFDWVYKGETSSIDIGLGFTLKGSGVGDPVSELQNYVFIGKPNNGDIIIPILADYRALVGNPYPSALDADRFIIDNGPSGTNSIDGALYFWEHSTTNNSHVLSEYEGGYAAYNLSGGLAAVSAPTEIGGLGAASKIPTQFVPVAQGFYVTSSTVSGDVYFNNDQRVFEKESTDNSIFLRAAKSTIASTEELPIKRVRLNVTSTDGSKRPLLLAFTPNNEATESIDYGYDCINTDVYPNDASFLIDNEKFVIQGVGPYHMENLYPLGLFLSTPGEVEVSLTELENFQSDIDVFVYDVLTDTSVLINTSSFRIVLSAGDYLERFFIAFAPRKTLGLSSELIEDVVQIFYLTNTHELYIRLPQNLSLKQVELYNLLNQKVKAWDTTDSRVGAGIYRIPVDNLAKGPYVVKLKSNSPRLIVKKIIISD